MQRFHVGLPCLKLSLHPSNQKHHGKVARTCSVKDAWREMNDERRGRDKTIDHDKTGDNVWLCGNSEIEMEQMIQAEIDRINMEREAHGKRKLRCDAVSAIELIQKPPIEILETMTREEQIRLLKDSDEVVESILHDWRPEWKTLATVIHFDELGGKAPHPHKIFIPLGRDEDGCPVLNAKRDFNLKFFTFMNREYPVRMRERGYPVLDCEIYEDLSEEKREAHWEKKKDYGMEGYEYKQKKNAEQEAKIAANGQIIKTQTERIETNDKTLAAQKLESKELGIRILSKKQVQTLPEPAVTLDGQYYKVPKREYKNLRATAAQVDIGRRENDVRKEVLDKREADLKERAAEIENKRKLPVKDQMELAKLHLLKRSMEWLAEQSFISLPVRQLLVRALAGEDLQLQSEWLQRAERIQQVKLQEER